jgi:hypothetical protein
MLIIKPGSTGETAMPEFKFEVQLSATVGTVTSSEEGARQMLHEIVRGWHGTAKIEAVELIAIDREPVKEPPAL